MLVSIALSYRLSAASSQRSASARFQQFEADSVRSSELRYNRHSAGQRVFAPLRTGATRVSMNRRMRMAGSSSCWPERRRDAPGRIRRPPPQGRTRRPSSVQVDYVEVDAFVTDQQGRFVRDLKKEDFQVFEDGKAQTISAFTLVDIPIERVDRPLFAAQPIEPDVRTNARPFDGRIYIVVLDDLHVQPSHTHDASGASCASSSRRSWAPTI